MGFGSFNEQEEHPPLAEINTTPLVDVMLVLLVIFIITAPLLTHAIRLDLPRERASASADTAPRIVLSIDADGRVHWDREIVDDASLATRLAQASQRDPRPDVHLRADKATRYERIAYVLAAAQRAGLPRVAFVTDPATPSP
ncbi:MAG TPA: biopolymer transporter ExbD [Burkholderiaceae bacterium]|nr:biopolymer transporter ExbD [Burkholderiaceae bacterium]